MKRLTLVCAVFVISACALGVELYSNGTYITGTNTNGDTISQALAYGTGPGGATNSAAGFNFDKDEGYAIADDFVVPGGQTWDTQALRLFAYQTSGGTSTTPTLTAAYVRIYNGDPRSGGVLVSGDNTTNRLVSGTFTNVYRVFNGTTTPSFLLNKQRAIIEYTLDLSWAPDLSAGTYFVAVSTTGSLSSGPWWVPISELASNNAALEDAGVWGSLYEEQLLNGASQNPVVQRPRDVMFKLDGNIIGSAVTVNPNNFVIGPGSALSGGLASLFSSDDDKLISRPGAVLVSTATPLRIVVEGTAPASTASLLQFVLESSASIANANEQVEVFNFTSGNYDAAISDTTATTSDTVKTLGISNPSDHIGPGNLLRVRISYKANGAVLVYPWQARIDEATWRFTP